VGHTESMKQNGPSELGWHKWNKAAMETRSACRGSIPSRRTLEETCWFQRASTKHRTSWKRRGFYLALLYWFPRQAVRACLAECWNCLRLRCLAVSERFYQVLALQSKEAPAGRPTAQRV